jgi:parvulin-like peptidyl-prolyl isomerase
MKPTLLTAAGVCALGLSLAALATAAPLFGDPVVAKGKGIEIRRSELDEITTGFRATAAGRGQRVPAEQMASVEQDMLDRLIQIRILNLHATVKEKESGQTLGTQRFEEFKKSAVSEEVFNSKLKSLGSTADKLKARLIEEAVGELVLNREVRSPVTISDDEVKKFYDDNPGVFERPEQVRVLHILLTSHGPNNLPLPEAEVKAKREKLEGILKRAKAGEDFASLVKLFSEDTNVKDKGGELTFAREGRYLEFEAVAFSLAPGQISEVVASPFGFHIIKLIEKIPAKRTPLDDVAKDIKQKLEDREVLKRMPDFFGKYRKELDVVVQLEEK